ncbi:hypothetical protein ANCCEY_15374, partial [Ancylostoma ceylanicum]
SLYLSGHPNNFKQSHTSPKTLTFPRYGDNVPLYNMDGSQHETLGYCVVRLLKEFEWDNLSIIFTSNVVNYCDDIVADVEAAISDDNSYNPVIVYKEQINKSDTDPFHNALSEIRLRSRRQSGAGKE